MDGTSGMLVPGATGRRAAPPPVPGRAHSSASNQSNVRVTAFFQYL